jgi:hypothetical protein
MDSMQGPRDARASMIEDGENSGARFEGARHPYKEKSNGKVSGDSAHPLEQGVPVSIIISAANLAPLPEVREPRYFTPILRR